MTVFNLQYQYQISMDVPKAKLHRILIKMQCIFPKRFIGWDNKLLLRVVKIIKCEIAFIHHNRSLSQKCLACNESFCGPFNTSSCINVGVVCQTWYCTLFMRQDPLPCIPQKRIVLIVSCVFWSVCVDA